MKTFEEEKQLSIVDGKTKWPLNCGCTGDHYYARCGSHQQEYHEDQGRRMGIVDLKYSAQLFGTDQGRDQVIREINQRIALHPTKPILIKITPELS